MILKADFTPCSALGKKHSSSGSICCGLSVILKKASTQILVLNITDQFRLVAPLKMELRSTPQRPFGAVPGHVPGQRRADLQPGKGRDDFDCGAASLDSRQVV